MTRRRLRWLKVAKVVEHQPSASGEPGFVGVFGWNAAQAKTQWVVNAAAARKPAEVELAGDLPDFLLFASLRTFPEQQQDSLTYTANSQIGSYDWLMSLWWRNCLACKLQLDAGLERRNWMSRRFVGSLFSVMFNLNRFWGLFLCTRYWRSITSLKM